MIQALSKSVKQFGTAILLLVSLVVLAEIWLRFEGTTPVPTVTSQVSPALQSMLVPSSTTHHEMRRLSKVQLADNVVLQTNSLGLRGTLPEEPKHAGVIRVVILGDETILAPHLANAETVPGRVGQFLSKAEQQFEIINAGVPGFSPLLSWLQFRHELQELNPDVVILHFDMSDVADDEKYRPLLQADGAKQVCCNSLLKANSGTTNRIAGVMHDSALCGWLKRRTGFQVDSGSHQSPRLNQRYQWTETNRSDLRLAIRHAFQPIESLRESAAKNEFHLIVSTSPVPWQVTSSEQFPSLSKSIALNSAWPITDDLPTKLLTTLCAKSSITFCDSTPSFRNYSEPDRLFAPDNYRLSRYGAALYAREIAATLLGHENTKMSKNDSAVF